MNEIHHCVSVESFGGVANNPSADNSIALNLALIAAQREEAKSIIFGKGNYYFKTPPNIINFGIDIIGHGKGRTVLTRDYNENHVSKGFLSFQEASASSSTVRDLGIVAERNSKGGSAISILANGNGAPDYCSFHNLYLSSRAERGKYTWDSTIYIDGRQREDNPIGVRDTDFINCSVFGGRYTALSLYGVVALNFIGGGVFAAGGLSGKVKISGSERVNSHYVNFQTGFINGGSLDYCQFCKLSAYFTDNITTASSAQHIIIIGIVKGDIEPYWTNSEHYGHLV